MSRLVAAGLPGLLLAILPMGCAPPPVATPEPVAAGPADGPRDGKADGKADGRGDGGWEPAPTTAAPLRPQRDNGRRGLSVSRSPLLSGTGARGAMGWPDRYQEDLGGAPYRPQY
ncbi:hypothetical protein [Roseomonas gilardii]|uniref:hypothetical protein n=1 Tax=Roseomonas gilardii TaxID=257708 RepID=UPI0004BB0152|nr:hypothetical protein [Roseomonas gilardii]SUE43573.1 Uncharacterised protein [Roseomonas gilardii subsp. rosea]